MSHRFLEEARAEKLLAELDLHEDIAELAVEAPLESERAAWARRYWKLIGVHPCQRGVLRQELEPIARGERPHSYVDKLIWDLNRELA